MRGYKKCSITRKNTTPYTPHQTGVAERMNRMLMEKARFMLSDDELGKEFWAEAVGTACYLINLYHKQVHQPCTNL